MFFDVAGIPWEYEPQGYDLGKAGKYLPDFLINAGTHAEHFFEVKGRPPDREELAKAEALCEQAKLPVYVYYDQVRLPGSGLTGMSWERFEEAMHQRFARVLAGEFLQNPSGHQDDEFRVTVHRTWVDDCEPTCYRSFTREGVGYSKPLPLWWTDCPRCGLAVPKVWGQVGSCPKVDAEDTYPQFAHETPRLTQAYDAARSYRFDRR